MTKNGNYTTENNSLLLFKQQNIVLNSAKADSLFYYTDL